MSFSNTHVRMRTPTGSSTSMAPSGQHWRTQRTARKECSSATARGARTRPRGGLASCNSPTRSLQLIGSRVDPGSIRASTIIGRTCGRCSVPRLEVLDHALILIARFAQLPDMLLGDVLLALRGFLTQLKASCLGVLELPLAALSLTLEVFDQVHESKALQRANGGCSAPISRHPQRPRKMMRPLLRSYGVNSTVTVSPVRMRM